MLGIHIFVVLCLILIRMKHFIFFPKLLCCWLCLLGSSLWAQQDTGPAFYSFSFDAGWIIAHGTVNDTLQARFLLDTGATDIALSRRFVDSCHINRMPLHEDELTRLLGGGVGQDSGGMLIGREPISVACADAYVSSPSYYKVYPDMPVNDVDVLLGITPELEHTLEVYYTRRLFRFYPGKPQVNLDKSWQRIRYVDQLTKITVPLKLKVGGKTIKGQFLIDTGSRHALALTRQTMLEHGLDRMELCDRGVRSLGLSGRSDVAHITAEEVTLGKNKLTGVDVLVFFDEKGALAGSKIYDGIIGNRLLEHCDLVIDYTGKYLYLRLASQ